MNSGLLFLLFCGIISEHLGFGQNGQKSAKVSKKLNLKVHINATGDTLVMKFLRPSQNTKLEGFILGYGSSFFSNQYIQWPENGKSFVTEVDAEPRYLISIKPNENHKKSCKEKNSTPKPLQLVIGTLTPTSVFLSWGILINPQIDWSVLNKCPNDRFYTVRYREKNKDWLFQLCPTTEVVIDNLKPNTMYEFGVKDNTDGGIWSNLYNQKTLPKGKENGQSYNVYKIPKGVIQLSPENTKAFIPITVYKQGFQNISNLIKSKTTAAAPPTEQIVIKEEPIKPSTTTKSPTPKPKPVIKVTEPPPAPKTEKPDTEDLNPAVTGQPFVESIPLDSSTDTLEWVRATMATPYIPVPNASPEPPTIDDQSKASTLASPIFAPAPLTRGPLQQPETVMESGSLTTQALEAGSISQIVSVRGHPLSAINPPGTTTALPIMQQTTLGKSSTVISVTLRPEVPTEGILPASPDAAALVTRVPHKKTTFGIKTRIITTTLGHSSSIPVKHPSTTDKPQTSTHATIKPKRPKLERRLSQTTSSSAPLVPSKTTLETRKKAKTPKGIHPKSTDASPITMHVPIKPQTTMLAVREKDSVYAHTTKPSLEHPQTLHATSGKSLTYVATRKSISEPPQTMHVSRGKHPTYVPTEKSSMEHPITPDGLSLIQPSSPTALDATSKITLITQKQERTAEAGRYQLSTDEQQTSPYIHVKHQQTTMAGGHPMSTYKPQVSTDLPVKMHRTTMAPSGKHPKYLTTTKPSMEHPHTAHDEPIIAPPSTSTPELTMEIPPVTLQQAPSIEATTRQSIPDKYSTLPPQSLPKPTTVFTGGHFFPTTTQDIPKTEGPLIIPVSLSTETPLFHSKAIPSTEAPQYADDSTQPAAEITSTDVPYTSKQEEIILDSSDKTFVHTFATTAKPDAEITAASQETPKLHSTKTPSIPKQSTLAPKRSHLHLIQSSMSPTIEAKSPTPVLKTTEAISLTEEHAETLVSTIKTSSPAPNALIPTESPLPTLDRKTPHRMPINLIRVHFFEDSDQSTVPGITGKTRITTDNPLPKDDLKTPQRMPINLIRVHFHDDTEQTTVPNKAETDFPPKFRKTTESPLPKHAASESQTTSSPTPKPTKSSKKSLSEPVVKTTQTPPQPKTTQRPESPHTKPVPIPTQKVSPPKTKKPQTPRPRAKSAPTRPPQVSNKPIVTHQIREATLAPYRVHPSSSRPRASVRPRARPVQNGTVRARPTGDVMTAPIAGGRLIDHTKLLGVSRNISVELNNTGKRPPSVSSAPILPIRPTSMRRRFPPTNVTGRPGGPGSILVPRAPSTPKPNRTTMPIKTPTKQPTYPSPEDNTVETTVFSPSPKSDIDALGKTRYTAPHVKYMSKDDKIPCSITESLRHFPHEEANNNEDITNPPQNPPSNLTVVTVEGCPSFVILDWDPSDNDTVTEYEVISKENGGPPGKDQSIITTNQTHSTVENLKPDTSYEFHVIPKNPLGEGPVSNTVEFNTESADPRVSEPVKAGKDAIWTEIKFKPDSYSECKGKMYVKRTWYKKFVGIQLCNSLRYKIYLSDSLTGTFYNIGDQSGFGEDHCQFVDSFLDGRTGQQLLPDQLARRKGFYRSVRQQPVDFGEIGGNTHISYVHWYECGIAIPGKW